MMMSVSLDCMGRYEVFRNCMLTLMGHGNELILLLKHIAHAYVRVGPSPVSDRAERRAYAQ